MAKGTPKAKQPKSVTYTGEAVSPVSLMVRPSEEHPFGVPMQHEAAYLCAHYRGWVRVAVSRNAQAVASTRWRAYRTTEKGGINSKARKSLYERMGVVTKSMVSEEDGVEKLPENNPINALLREAWPGGNCFDLFELTEMFLSLTGNAFWLKTRDKPNGQVVGLWPIPPQFVRIEPSKDSYVGIGKYWIGRERTLELPYDPSEVVHFKMPNPSGTPYVGMGDLAGCLTEAQTSDAISMHGLSTLQQGAQPGLIFKAKKPIDPKEMTRMKSDLDAKYQGPAKAGRNMVVSQDFDVDKWDAQQQELSYLITGDQLRDFIGNQFGQSRAMMTSDSAALATAKEAIPTWQRLSVEPRCKRICDAINQQLIQPDFGPEYFVMFDDVVDRDVTAAFARGATASGGPIATVNEARADCGLPPVKGGDEIRQPASSAMPSIIAIDQQSKEKPEYRMPPEVADRVAQYLEKAANGAIAAEAAQSLIMMMGVPEKQARELADAAVVLTEVEEPEETPNTPAGEETAKEEKPAEPEPEEDKPADDKPDDVAAKSIDPATCDCGCGESIAAKAGPPTQITLTSAQLGNLLESYYNGLGEYVAIQLENGATSVDLNADPSLTDSLRNIVAQPLETAGKLAMANESAKLNISSEWGKQAAEALSRQTIQFASDSLNRLSDRINSAIQESIRNGATILETADAIRGVANVTASHAATIAETETARAYETGRVETFKDPASGVIAKEWLMSGDPCPVCSALSGRIVGLDDAFWPTGTTIAGVTNKGKTVTEPPAHPNCHCSIGAVYPKGNTP